MFPTASITLWSQKYKGTLCNLTQTDIQDTTIILALKSGNQGVTKSLVEPKNHGSSCNIDSQSSHDVNFSMKKPLEQSYISQFIAQFVNIQWKLSTGFGQKLLNLHNTA